MKTYFENFRLIIVGVGISTILSCQATKQSNAVHPPVSVDPDVFEKTIRPMLEHRCIHCHNNNKPNAGLNFQNPSILYAQTKMGSFLDPGNPESSRVYMAILKPKTHPGAMPGDGWGIDLLALQAFRTWIKEGAKWPEGDGGQLEVKDYQVIMPDDR